MIWLGLRDTQVCGLLDAVVFKALDIVLLQVQNSMVLSPSHLCILAIQFIEFLFFPLFSSGVPSQLLGIFKNDPYSVPF